MCKKNPKAEGHIPQKTLDIQLHVQRMPLALSYS